MLPNDKTDLEGLVLGEEQTDFGVRHGVLKLLGRSLHRYDLLWGVLVYFSRKSVCGDFRSIDSRQDTGRPWTFRARLTLTRKIQRTISQQRYGEIACSHRHFAALFLLFLLMGTLTAQLCVFLSESCGEGRDDSKNPHGRPCPPHAERPMATVDLSVEIELDGEKRAILLAVVCSI